MPFNVLSLRFVAMNNFLRCAVAGRGADFPQNHLVRPQAVRVMIDDGSVTISRTSPELSTPFHQSMISIDAAQTVLDVSSGLSQFENVRRREQEDHDVHPLASKCDNQNVKILS
jgi:hypothetical protein